ALAAVTGEGSGFGLQIGYSPDGPPRGAAGCVRDAGLRTGSDTIVVTDGAAIPTIDLAELLAFHDVSRAAVTAVVHRECSPSAPPTPGGVYVFARRALDYVPAAGFQDITENL